MTQERIDQLAAEARAERREARRLAAREAALEEKLEKKRTPTDRQVALLLSRSTPVEIDDRPDEELSVDELQARAMRGPRGEYTGPDDATARQVAAMLRRTRGGNDGDDD